MKTQSKPSKTTPTSQKRTVKPKRHEKSSGSPDDPDVETATDGSGASTGATIIRLWPILTFVVLLIFSAGALFQRVASMDQQVSKHEQQIEFLDRQQLRMQVEIEGRLNVANRSTVDDGN